MKSEVTKARDTMNQFPNFQKDFNKAVKMIVVQYADLIGNIDRNVAVYQKIRAVVTSLQRQQERGQKSLDASISS